MHVLRPYNCIGIYWTVPKQHSKAFKTSGYLTISTNNNCAKFHYNRPFTFKVMIKKLILDENFCNSLRQSWKKIVETLDSY